ncbi:HDIG domain-containing protein [Psychrobacillus sp. Sa2BUA9]|uniref:HDIG domain-containing protein n=1 Tax=Psychrobacillus faecigallinarum TaxID=2762235 RepID=A0ABR8R7R2_9BACI|nr:HDIG domain-containing metalloprotein [Psychrobacillus faecigallinarum]MBD7943838.1 HDIG domain-containing protein [Psychrobacillus faecigallinarum]
MKSLIMKWKRWRENKYLPIIIILLTSISMFLLIKGSVQENTYDISLMNLAPETIRSVKTMEDPVKTEEEKERAAAEVSPVYQFQEETAENQSTIAESIFDSVLDVKGEISPDEPESAVESLQKLKKEMNVLTENDSFVPLTDDALNILLKQNPATLNEAKEKLPVLVEETLNEPIRTENLAIERDKVVQKVRTTFNFPDDVMNVLISIARGSIIATEIKNDELTDLRIEQAKASVEPTRILQGQILVQKGEIVSKEVYRQLELLGMLTNKSSYKPYIGVSLFVLLTMWVLFGQTIRVKESNLHNTKNLIVVAFSVIVSVLMMKVLQSVAYNFDIIIAFLFPTAMVSMLVYILVNERAAFISNFVVAAYAGIIFQEGYTNIFQMEVALYILFGGIAGIFAMQHMYNNSQILRSSLIVASVNLTFILFYLLMTKTTYEFTDIAFYIGAALVSGVLSGALTLGILPFFESAFGILSTMRLIELSSPNHPLLKKILTETPGTYHHSLMVANLAEAACEAIGANGLLARVGCYYHDIGKTNRPGFFIENQVNGYNPHDNLSPEASKDIIISHAVDGADILKKNKLPKEIIDVAEQHHGTSLLKFFYHKAKEMNPNIEEGSFRYPSPKPQTKEIAIISVADSVEAAVRSMKEPNAEKIHRLIQSIIKDKVIDGQFDECDLSFKEIKKIEESFCSTMNGTFHSRIEYPK